MDALPVKELKPSLRLPKAASVIHGQRGDVMHAVRPRCAHRNAMAVAENPYRHEPICGQRSQCIFQPARREPSLFAPLVGKSWGDKFDAGRRFFERSRRRLRLHVVPGRSGEITYRKRGDLAARDTLEITVTEARPCACPGNVDPIVNSGDDRLRPADGRQPQGGSHRFADLSPWHDQRGDALQHRSHKSR